MAMYSSGTAENIVEHGPAHSNDFDSPYRDGVALILKSQRWPFDGSSVGAIVGTFVGARVGVSAGVGGVGVGACVGDTTSSDYS